MISRRRVAAASLVVTGGLVIAGLAGLAVGPASIGPGEVVRALAVMGPGRA